MLLSQITVPGGWTHASNPDGSGPCTGEWHLGGSTRQMTFILRFDDVESFAQQVSGLPTSYNAGGLVTIVQQSPLVYPFNAKLYAQRITMRAASANPRDATPITPLQPYSMALVTVEFSTFDFPPNDGSSPWLKIDVKGSTEFITIAGTPYSFSSGEKIEQDVGRIVGLQSYSITRMQIPSFDQWLGISNPLVGSVSSAAVTIGATTIAAGYLLFPTQDVSSEASALGSPQTQASFNLVYRQLAWNSGIRSDGTVDTISPAIYPTADLNPLIH